MTNSSPKPILNTSLPPNFRQIRIELAREHEHPAGSHNIAYILVAPLDSDATSIKRCGSSIAKPAA